MTFNRENLNSGSGGSAQVTLRPLRDEDIVLMERWLKTPHVANWYLHPEHWLRELCERQGEFSFLTHFIAEHHGLPVGFCQFYDCYFAQQHEVWNDEWHVGDRQGEVYSIDYLVGEPKYLRRGFAGQMVRQMTERIWETGAKRILARPEPENTASCRVLLSVGFLPCGEDFVLENPCV